MWGVVQQNSRKAQAAYAAQYDKKREDHSFQLGDRVMWFRPQDLKGDLRKFAMPYVGPYVVVEVNGLHTAKIRLENEDDTKSILVNVDQLSRCYPEFAPKVTLNYSRIKKKRRANRKRISLPQGVNIAPFHHLTTLTNVSNSDLTYGIVLKVQSSNPIDSQNSQMSEWSINNLNVCFLDFACRKEQILGAMSSQPPHRPPDSEELPEDSTNLTPAEIAECIRQATEDKRAQRRLAAQQAQGSSQPSQRPGPQQTQQQLFAGQVSAQRAVPPPMFPQGGPTFSGRPPLPSQEVAYQQRPMAPAKPHSTMDPPSGHRLPCYHPDFEPWSLLYTQSQAQ
ncbi:MAG: hypothetical protein GY820_21425, partial [Gammaproteobacteria bacterium]|nr:hypothetical protein [Gammaproteobacteria bacterium]